MFAADAVWNVQAHRIGRITLSSMFALLIMLPGFAFGSGSEPTQHAPIAQLEGADLIRSLQRGGYIIYFRHGITDQETSDTDRENLSTCATQRLLSPKGIAEMEEIGRSIARLKIRAGSILSSPYCRALDSARLAFGRVEINDDLKHTVAADEATVQRQADALRHLLSAIPEHGFNTVLTGHTANLQEATGIWPKPEGVAIIFKPLGDNQFSYIGTILPAQWKEMADRTRSQ